MFVVVIATLIINTVIAKGPIIFLKLAETNQGEFDGIYTPAEHRLKSYNNYYNEDGYFLNYTQIFALYDT